MNERRSIGRTKIAKDALLFFREQTGVRSCAVTDGTNAGAGIRTQGLPAIPLNFKLSFDKFRTIRKCRLIWRDTPDDVSIEATGCPGCPWHAVGV